MAQRTARRSVELTARGLEHFTTASPSIALGVQLPDFECSTMLAWPPPKPSMAVQVATSMTYGPHPGANWWQESKERAQAIREEHARVIEHYDAMARAREEQPNQSELASLVVRLRCGAGRCAGCTALAVVRQRVSGMEITNTGQGRRKPLRFGSSSNRSGNPSSERQLTLFLETGKLVERTSNRRRQRKAPFFGALRRGYDTP